MVVSIPGHQQRYLIGVSVRSPHAARYTEADTVAGSAAAKGAKEKTDLYGPEVLPLVFETYGRLGSEGHHTLDVLQTALSGLTWGNHSRLRHTLRARCEDALARATADVALLALGGGAAAMVVQGM